VHIIIIIIVPKYDLVTRSVSVLRPRRIPVRKRIAGGRRPPERNDRGQREPGHHSGGRPPGWRTHAGRQQPPVLAAAAAAGFHTPDSTLADKRRGRHTDQARTVSVAQRTAQPDHHKPGVTSRFK